MVKGFKAILFVAVTAIYAVSCVRGDNPINRPDNRRNDGGVQFLGPGWSKVAVPNNCLDVFFTNDTAGYLAGNGIYRSMDGGQTWNKTNAQDLVYYNLYFLNDKYGWGISEKALARTVDSGKTWQTLTSTFSFTDVYFLDENNGFAVSPSGVLKSTDGGSTWSLLAGSPTNAYNLVFRDANNGFFSTSSKGLYATTDGGATFSRISALPASMYSVQFLSSDPLKGYTIGVPNPDNLLGDVYKTQDGGATWTKLITINDNYFDFHFGNGDKGFVMTPNMVFKVENNVSTKVLYTPIPSNNQVYLTECHFTDDLERGWVIYNGGTLFRYVQP